MTQPSTYEVRYSSGKWYIDERHAGGVERTFRRFRTEAEAREEAERLTREEASLARYIARRAREEMGE